MRSPLRRFSRFCLTKRSYQSADSVCIVLEPASRLRCAVFRENYLPELDVTGSECARAGEQVVFPHSLQGRTVPSLEFRPVALKLAVPGHERLVIVWPKVVPVLHNK